MTPAVALVDEDRCRLLGTLGERAADVELEVWQRLDAAERRRRPGLKPNRSLSAVGNCVEGTLTASARINAVSAGTRRGARVVEAERDQRNQPRVACLDALDRPVEHFDRRDLAPSDLPCESDDRDGGKFVS